MVFEQITSSRTFHLIPAQDDQRVTPSKSFRLIPAENYKSKLIKQLQKILPENGGFVANFNREKENFGIEIVESKDEFIAHIASVQMLDMSIKFLLDYIQENENDYTPSDFLKLLKEQIDVQVGIYNLISGIKGLHDSKSMDESIGSGSLRKYLEKRAVETIDREQFEELNKLINLYNKFIVYYEEILQSGEYIEKEVREDILDVFQRFHDNPDDIDTPTLMKIEKTIAASKRVIPYSR